MAGFLCKQGMELAERPTIPAGLSSRLGRARLEPGPTAALTFHFFVAQLDQPFAFAIGAFFFFLTELLHGFSKSKTELNLL